MSRPRTPLKVLEDRGALKKNPQRYRARIMEAAMAPEREIGPPPEKWNVPAESFGAMKFARWKAIWNEFAPQVPNQTQMKRAILELFVEQMDKFRTNAASMKASEKVYLLQLIKTLGTDERVSGGSSQKPAGFGGQWEAFG